uniref:C2H2-type domain-containing protein n=1 Tax=Pristionchus pacificus TaxID=54126 RepID=A0A2A6CXD7_PRIPA|eukprot:PDM82894.1 hypothetical protein PRIPAC_37287 [Pristionchus pacificus]
MNDVANQTKIESNRDDKQEQNPLECNECGKSYSCPWNLQRHLKIHKPKRIRSEIKKNPVDVAEELDVFRANSEEARYFG